MKTLLPLGKLLIYIGIFLVFTGGLLVIASRIGLPLGRLPGDFSFRGKHFQVFAPFGTMILVSIILTVVMNLLLRWLK